MRLPFGPFTPDLPAIASSKSLVTAKNMRPQLVGYEPINALVTLPNATALTSRPRGPGISGIDSSGAGFLYAGTETTLEHQGDSGMVDASQAGGYALGETDRWSFTKFGDFIFAAAPAVPMQFHKIGSPNAFADVQAFAPQARHIATVGNHLFAGNLYDREAGVATDAVRWCGINAPFTWPAIGSDDAVSVQADFQPLEGNGGWVQDIVSAAEVAVIFQERQLHRFEYIGGRGIYSKKRLAQSNGMLIPASAVAFDRLVFYIGEDGFRIFNMLDSEPIGKDRVSATFLADLDTAYFDRVETAKDPDRTQVWTIYPGAGNTGGRPNKGIIWDYKLDRWSHFEIDLEGLIHNATTTAPSIDAPASAGDPDDVDDPSGEDSFDDRQSTFGASSMGGFDTSFVSGAFTGTALAALIETGDIEVVPGQRGWISGVRPLVDGRKAEVSISGRGMRDDDIVFGPYVPMDGDGVVPFRSDDRYHRLRVRMPAGWQDAVGVDIHGGTAGDR